MRYSEIATLPGTPEEAKQTILDMIAVYQAKGHKEIPINVVLKTLHKQNFDIDRRLLVDLIQGEPSIERVSGDTIVIDTGEEEPELLSPDEAEMSKEKVKQMSKKAIDIGGK